MSDKNNDGWGCAAQAAMFMLILWGFQCVSRSTSETDELKRKFESLEQELRNVQGSIRSPSETDELKRKVQSVEQDLQNVRSRVDQLERK